jgi:hypothetical protein
VARVEFTLAPAAGGGTRVKMVEAPTGGVLGAVPNPGLAAAIRLRNAETLRRLERVVVADS